MKKKLLLVLAGVLVGAIIFSGCSTPNGGDVSKPDIVVPDKDNGGTEPGGDTNNENEQNNNNNNQKEYITISYKTYMGNAPDPIKIKNGTPFTAEMLAPIEFDSLKYKFAYWKNENGFEVKEGAIYNRDITLDACWYKGVTVTLDYHDVTKKTVTQYVAGNLNTKQYLPKIENNIKGKTFKYWIENTNSDYRKWSDGGVINVDNLYPFTDAETYYALWHYTDVNTALKDIESYENGIHFIEMEINSEEELKTLGNGLCKIAKPDLYIILDLRTTKEELKLNITNEIFPSTCSIIKEINFPFIEKFESGSLSFCSNLNTLKIPENTNYVFDEDGLLYTKDKKILLQLLPKSTICDFNCETIASKACMNNLNLTLVTIGSDLKTIEKDAFRNCNITNVHFENSYSKWQIGEKEEYFVTYIYNRGVKTSSVNYPEEAVDGTEKNAEFLKKSNNDTLKITNKPILFSEFFPIMNSYYGGDYMRGKIKLIATTDEIKQISNKIYDMNKREKSWDKPEGFIIADGELSFDFTECNWEELPENCFSHYINQNRYESITDMSGIEIGEIILPNTLKTIGKYAFYQCNEITEIVIPEGVTSIGDYAFAEISTLTSVILPNSLKTIGNCTFHACRKLNKIQLPPNLEEIGIECFSFNNTSDVIVIPTSVQKIGSMGYNNRPKEIKFDDKEHSWFLYNYNNEKIGEFNPGKEDAKKFLENNSSGRFWIKQLN